MFIFIVDCKIWCQRCHIVVTKFPTLNMVGGCRYKLMTNWSLTYNYSNACLDRIKINYKLFQNQSKMALVNKNNVAFSADVRKFSSCFMPSSDEFRRDVCVLSNNLKLSWRVDSDKYKKQRNARWLRILKAKATLALLAAQRCLQRKARWLRILKAKATRQRNAAKYWHLGISNIIDRSKVMVYNCCVTEYWHSEILNIVHRSKVMTYKTMVDDVWKLFVGEGEAPKKPPTLCKDRKASPSTWKKSSKEEPTWGKRSYSPSMGARRGGGRVGGRPPPLPLEN